MVRLAKRYSKSLSFHASQTISTGSKKLAAIGLFIFTIIMLTLLATPNLVGAAVGNDPFPDNSDMFNYLLAGENQILLVDDFETGDFSQWSSVKNGVDLTNEPGAAVEGGFGMQVLVNDTSTHYVKDLTPDHEDHYRACFYFDLNSLTMANNNQFVLFRARDNANVFQINLRYKNNAYEIRARVWQDDNTKKNGSWHALADDWQAIEVEWQTASSAASSDGFFNLWIDGVQVDSITGLSNFATLVEEVRLGSVVGIDSGTTGTYYIDAFYSQTEDYIGLLGEQPTPAPTATATNTPPPTPTSPPPPSTGLTSGLISYWTLDEANGIRQDIHGSNDLTDNNSVTSSTGVLGNTAAFSSANSEWLSVGDDPSQTLTNQFTFGAWFNMTDLATQRTIASKWTFRTQGEWAIQTSNGASDELQVFIAGSPTDGGNYYAVTTNADLAADAWYFLLVSYDGSGASNADRLKIYINDIEQSLSFERTIPSSLQDGSADLAFGKFPGLNRFWNGEIDEVGLWDRVLTSQEHSDLYNNGAGLAYPFGAVSTTPTPTDVVAPTQTPLPSATPTSLPTNTPTDVIAPTQTHTPLPTFTQTALPSATPTSLPTNTPTQTVPTPTASAVPGNNIYWNIDFETGDFSQLAPIGEVLTQANGSHSIVSDVKHTGTYASLLEIEEQGTDAAYLFFYNAAPGEPLPDSFYLSTWIYLGADTCSSDWWNTFQFKSSADGNSSHSNSVYSINIRNHEVGNCSSPLEYQIFSKAPAIEAIHYQANPQPIPLAQWFHVEVFYHRDPSCGQIKMWQDGVEIFDLDCMPTVYPNDTLYASINNYAEGLSNLYYLDDIILANYRVGP